jgi:hypothetical protein
MPQIEISEETLSKIKEQFAGEFEQVEINNLQDLVGKNLFLRTVTYHLLGKVEKVIGNVLQLSSASWVADSGRFMQFIKDGSIDEVEPVGDWFVNFQSVVDFGIWKHKLPTEQK